MDDPLEGTAAPSSRGELFANYARIAFRATGSSETASEDRRRLADSVWTRLEEMYGELDEADRRWLGLASTRPVSPPQALRIRRTAVAVRDGRGDAYRGW